MATTTRPQLSSLKTPLSATYPSELRSPMVGTPTMLKREDGLNTPITPPAAYLDFLSKLSPTLMSPPASGPLRSSFGDVLPLSSTTSSEPVTTTASAQSTASTANTANSLPPSPPPHSSSRSSSCSSGSGDGQKADSNTKQTVIVPPSSFSRPASARTPRRLQIPASPYSPGNIRSPMSAATLYSPWSATLSPRELDSELTTPGGSTRAVSVRQVVTRTVTYARQTAPIVEPVPASKKRKIDGQS